MATAAPDASQKRGLELPVLGDVFDAIESTLKRAADFVTENIDSAINTAASVEQFRAAVDAVRGKGPPEGLGTGDARRSTTLVGAAQQFLTDPRVQLQAGGSTFALIAAAGVIALGVAFVSRR